MMPRDFEEWSREQRRLATMTTTGRQTERVHRAFAMFESDRYMRAHLAPGGYISPTARYYELRAWASYVDHAGIAVGEGGL